MTLSDFNKSLNINNPPAEASVYLKALWHDAKGNWHKAHELIQELTDKTASWIHAYLHRKEGDLFNADYWYTKAGKKRPLFSLEKEWEELISALLRNTSSL